MKFSFWSMVATLFAGLVIMTVPAFAAPTAAPLNFCNRTSQQVFVAVGYFSSGANDSMSSRILTGPFVTEGWWSVDPNECQTIHNPFDARYMYWYPWDGKRIDTPDDLSPGKHMCVRGASFTFEDQNVSSDACYSISTDTSHARWVIPHETDTIVNPNVNFTGYNINY